MRPGARVKHPPCRLLFIRTVRKRSPASNRRLRHRTGSADPPAWPEALAGSPRKAYRRWGISPRPEDVVQCRITGGGSLAPSKYEAAGATGKQRFPMRTITAERSRRQSLGQMVDQRTQCRRALCTGQPQQVDREGRQVPVREQVDQPPLRDQRVGHVVALQSNPHPRQ